MKKKIIFSLLILFLLFSLGVVSSTVYIQNTTAALERLIKLHQIEGLRQNLLLSIQTVQSELYTVGTPLGHKIDMIIDNVSRLDENAAKCTGCHHEPELDGRLKEVQKHIRDYQDSLSYYITATANRESIDRLKLNASEIGNTLLTETEKMSLDASSKLAVMTNKALERARIVRTILLITIFLTLIFSLLTAFRLTKSITDPISVLVNATRAIASGNLDYSVSYHDKTEFGELANNFNIMSVALKEGYTKLEEDVAKRKKAEEALRSTNAELEQEIVQRRSAEEALKESERRFRETLEGANLIALQLDLEGRIIFVNDYFAHLTNWNLDDIAGHNWFDLFVPEDARDAMLQLHHQNTLGKIVGENVSEIMAKHGSRLLIAWTNSGMMDADGNVIGLTSLGMDITERQQIEEQILKNQKLEAVGTLAGGIAHDFNNLLQGIFGFIAMAKLNSDKHGKAHDFLDQAEASLSIATNLTNQLLTFAKGGKPVKKILSIETVIKNAVRLGLSGSRSVHSILFDDHLWHVEADAGQIGQVIQNIVINADDAMPQGGTITLSARNVMHTMPNSPETKFVEIIIEDTGGGITEDHLKKIFDPYFTTKQTGTGLGLATAYSIIKNHGGMIEVESAPGKGAKFKIYLPAATSGEIPEESAAQTAESRVKGNILVMDDEEVVLQVSCEMLKALGHDIELAKDGEEAIAKYQAAMNNGKTIDMVILDLTIRGGMGGAETNKRLHEIDPHVKTIISSGYSDDTTIAHYKELGFQGYLKKPYRLADLKDMLTSLL
jgi:two-component system cell cycle sensor histidine kinase/response regulator CckA